ncbi:MAG: T9SS type A sorting domain-containing protein, partial [Bacteroidetes bacterium]|nr:T9SS type A sorting domain-containing protein [Bacteroidota bacterium]
TITIPFQLHDPEFTELHPSQLTYIQNYITQWETNLASVGFNHPDTGYAAYIDVTSFIDFYLMNEITRNVDGYRISSFLYKERYSEGGKIVAGPLWDFNIALGNANYCYGQYTDGWASNFNEYCGGGLDVPFWWNRLLEDSTYQQQVRCRWEYLRANAFSDEALMAKIDTLYNQLQAPAERHFVRWPILSTYVWPNFFIGDTYLEEIDYLKTWLVDRVTWMDQNMWGDSCQVDLAVATDNTPTDISIYPNPAQNTVNIKMSQHNPMESLWIINTMGQKILVPFTQQKDQTQINVSHLQSGIYVICVMDQQKKTYQTPIIIER